MKKSKLPAIALFAGAPMEKFDDLPPESSAAQMRFMVAGLVHLVEKGDMPRERFQIGHHYHTFPIDGRLECIASSIIDKDNRIIAWRMRRSKSGSILAHELQSMMIDVDVALEAVRQARAA